MIDEKKIYSLDEIIKYVSELEIEDDIKLFFRGEKKIYENSELCPLIYRKNKKSEKRNYIKKEDYIFRETQRFNEHEFSDDKTTFDSLSRLQHYSAPTRLLDISEDLFSAIYFAIAEIDADDTKEEKYAVIYVFEIKEKKLKYYDSDTVSVISNLAKIPLLGDIKSKRKLLSDVNRYRNNKKEFNKKNSVKYLLHEIREEKPQFDALIDPNHITSIQAVLPKFSSNRIKSQKGAFLLFGLNPDNYAEEIKIIDGKTFFESTKKIKHPIEKVHKILIPYTNLEKLQKELIKIGIRKPFIYPEIDKVSEFLIKECE